MLQCAIKPQEGNVKVLEYLRFWLETSLCLSIFFFIKFGTLIDGFQNRHLVKESCKPIWASGTLTYSSGSEKSAGSELCSSKLFTGQVFPSPRPKCFLMQCSLRDHSGSLLGFVSCVPISADSRSNIMVCRWWTPQQSLQLLVEEMLVSLSCLWFFWRYAFFTLSYDTITCYHLYWNVPIRCFPQPYRSSVETCCCHKVTSEHLFTSIDKVVAIQH